MQLVIVDQGPSCLWQPRPKRQQHAPIQLDDRELAWRNLKPLTEKKRPIKNAGTFVAPLGALEGIDHFVARIETIQRLTDQQARDAATHRALIEADKELPTIVEEFRANGFRAMSLSSSYNDDDEELEAANLAERHLGTVPYAFGVKGYTEPDEWGTKRPIYRNAEELPRVLRRIEWERQDSQCGPVLTVRLCADDNGKLAMTTAAAWMAKKLTPKDILSMGVKIKNASGFKTPEELEENRAWATMHGKIGSVIYGVTYGPAIPEQSMDDLGAEDLMDPEEDDENPKAPQELLLHDTEEISRVIYHSWTKGEETIHYAVEEAYVVVTPEPSPIDLEMWADMGTEESGDNAFVFIS